MPNPAVFRLPIVRMIACLSVLGGCEQTSTPTGPQSPNAPPGLLDSRSEAVGQLALATASLTGPPGLLNSRSEAVGERLPFRGEYHTIGGGLFAPGEPGSEARCNAQGLLTITFEIEGKASHLGRFTGTGSNCTGFPIPGPVAIQDGVFTLIVSNDDRLSGTYAGEQGAVGADGSAPFETALEITGGTGRFASAMGQFEDRGVINFATGFTAATFEGWIAYDASDRRG